jgi:penicillin-binding protein A
MDLQKYLLEAMDTRYARQIGMVAMDPESGKVLAMVGHDKEDGSNNPCIDARFPAASIFKVVTAAGVIEKCGMGKDSPLVYNGRKYTLYKSQLEDKDNKYTRHVTLEKSFAESINPVFGKLGVHKLKKESLESYGRAFGFNKQVEFELPLEPSNLVVSDKAYNWAEIASGFNRVTTISPMHGALIASAVLNGGMIPEPSIVEKITGETGETLYEYRPAVVQKAVGKKTSAILGDLMQATVASGTSRKIFRSRSRDRILSRLEIGGKTGSIDDQAHEARIDWFVGFAKDPKTKKQIVISVVVAHQGYIGLRAGLYAKKGFARFFQKYFAQEEKQTG